MVEEDIRRILTPIRFPIKYQNKRTLEKAMELSKEHEAELVILHVNLFQNGDTITEAELMREIRDKVGNFEASLVIKEGFLVEESILEEIVRVDPDLVVVGRKEKSVWNKITRKFMGTKRVDHFLKENCECEVISVH
ncbi:MAG: Nucleotide-binding protein UspA family [Candidatus Methanohalarchaeum thermophilum]|uniref:Nucleotide-binding protein UspA family n=1 Tax=Methanohalarchaeum thermophilum TaxID=1903181 RepID=A0A1Q6DS66_METT1|nr:MAG: Nucleotide-binding protein UspA family [Candidatus Methanohalarchaeum thermophilum]